MKRTKMKQLMIILATLLCFCTVGCSVSTGALQDSLVYLNYGTGIQENGEYNTELYGMNLVNDTKGADPGAFYVSEEEDPVYGGYYYMYVTGAGDTNDVSETEKYSSENLAGTYFYCTRSKDLYNWERAGYYDGGYSLGVEVDDWCGSNFYAPEVVRNPADGKYYMYFNAAAKEDLGLDYISTSNSYSDRQYIGVAVSESPMGPFKLICDTDATTGQKVPTINFQTGCNTEHPWSVIDASPFFDDDGTLYLYFRKENGDNYRDMNGSWGVKMKTMEYADYSTMTMLTAPDKANASNEPGNITEAKTSGALEWSEGGVNEGQFMFKHNGKYYLTYTVNGYTDPAYSVYQAVGDSPLGTFTKLSVEQGNPILNGSSLGWMTGTGHHVLIQTGDELMMVYHRHGSIYGWTSGKRRYICADRVNFVTNAEGMEVMTVNGPSYGLQWLPEEISGYTNLAQTAEIAVSTGTGTQYLADEVIPYYVVTEDMAYSSESGDVTVTLRWDEPVCVSSLMIYNSVTVDTAFSKISDIRFQLAEQPEWASQKYDYAVIKDLEVPSLYWDAEANEYIGGTPVVAEFDAIKVTEIQFTIAEEDRLQVQDKYGNTNTALKLSEIVVLGRLSDE